MPKKRVAVSLRKPAPAPDRGAPAPGVPAPAARVAAPEQASVDAFVSGAAAALEAAAAAPPANEGERPLEELSHPGPEGLRELAIRVPARLARRLLEHCSKHHLDLDQLVARAVEQYLQRESLSQPEADANGRASGTGTLGKRERSLLRHLVRWLRSLWELQRAARAA